jgi:hypothetical protein
VFRVVMLGVLADLTIHERHIRAIAAILMRSRMLRGQGFNACCRPP